MSPFSPIRRIASCLLLAVLLPAVVGCAQLPGAGPRLQAFERDLPAAPGTDAVQVIDLDQRVVSQLARRGLQTLFSETLASSSSAADRIGAGDLLEITLWEAPPATLFGAGSAPDPRLPASSGMLPLPAQPVDAEGFVMVPFAGRLKAAGLAPHALGEVIVRRLQNKAHAPEALVRVVRRESASVTVVGEVQQSTRLPLVTGSERLLDALAAAGGARQPVHKSVLQVTRDDSYHVMPLDHVIRDPRQNVRLQAGDVVTLLYQPQSLSVLGATGRQDEIAFEAQGITLSQALARAGGLVDNRAAAQGLFVFRFEAPDAIDWPRAPASVALDGRVPVVYRLDLRDPRSFFLMQGFQMHDRDVLFVSNAPATELQKFLNIVFSAVFPVVNLINATN